MVPIVVVMVFVASAANGHLELFPIVLMHQLGVFAAAAGIGCVLDTFISPPVAPPGLTRSRTRRTLTASLSSCC